MKKIIILFISIFLLTGCYDNIELNNLAIVTGIGIDYIDNEFYVTYEILNDIKTQDNTTLLSYTISGCGQNISTAFDNVNYKVLKKPYFAHLKVVLISQNILNGNLNKITDYLIRDTDIRDEFYLLVTNNITPEEILKSNNEHYPVVTDLIMNLIDNEKYNNNLAVLDIYQKTLSKIINPRIDAVLNSVSLINNEISLDHFYLLKDYNYKNILSIDDSSLYNLLTTNVFSKKFVKEYNEGKVIINITYSNSSIDVTNDKININLKLKGRIIENNPNFNLKDYKTYQKLNKDFSTLISNNITNYIKTLQENECDILGLQNIYYRKYRKDNNNLWLHSDVLVNTEIEINTKGFIFEVENEK